MIDEEYTINKIINDVEKLQEQNSYDFQEIKRIDNEIKSVSNKIETQIKAYTQLKKYFQSLIENPQQKPSLDETQFAKVNHTHSVNDIIGVISNPRAIYYEGVDTPCTGITLNKSTLTFSSTNVQVLVPTVIPTDTTDIVNWLSSNNNIATVNNGVVTPISNGNCIITATCGSKSVTCNVTVTAFNNGGGTEPDEPDTPITPTPVYYSITRQLTNCSMQNQSSTILENSSFTTTITADNGYIIETVKVTIGGVDKTNTVYSNGVITINKVTGNVVITATAIEEQVTPDVPSEFMSIGTVNKGGLSASNSVVPNSGDAQAHILETIDLQPGWVIGFKDESLYSKYKFALGLRSTAGWLQGSSGAYHQSSFTITQTGKYGLMFIKNPSGSFSDRDISELNENFGYIPTTTVSMASENYGISVCNEGIAIANSFDSNKYLVDGQGNRVYPYTLASNVIGLEGGSTSSGATNRLLAKRIGVIGDSYVAGHTLGQNLTWCKKLGDRNSMTVFNYGINGCLLSSNGTTGVVDRYNTMESNLDYIIVFAGHNDSGAGVTIGDVSNTDIKTFCGALNTICKGLLTKYPKARILFMTPSKRTGKELDYADAMIKVCRNYSIPVYDTYGELGILIGTSTGIASQKSIFELNNSIHLNELGQEYLSYKVEAKLLSL